MLAAEPLANRQAAGCSQAGTDGGAVAGGLQQQARSSVSMDLPAGVTFQQQHSCGASYPGHLRRRRAPAALVHSRHVGTERGVNVIRIGDGEFLLTATAGDAVHLSREAGPDETAQSAVPGWYLRPRRAASGVRWRAYNQAAISKPRWAETTLCGRQWIIMAGEDADEFGDGAVAPTCRRCLTIMDKLFPKPTLDDRFALIVEIITDTVAEHGYAEMRNVPGDQHAALRKQVRSAIRQRTGQGLQSLVHESMIIF